LELVYGRNLEVWRSGLEKPKTAEMGSVFVIELNGLFQ
jgi:hypothetical protein